MSNQVADNPITTIDWPVFILSGGFLLLFVATALFDLSFLSGVVNSAFGGATKLFGAYWQVLMLLTFIIALGVAASDSGRARLGNLSAPDISTYKWVAIIMCTLLAGGGVFWAAAEPMAHFIASPPLFGVESASPAAVYPALAQSYMHWGFLAWSVLGSLTAIIFMYLHYDKGLPLKPRILLYPVFGEVVLHGWLGALIDAACVVAVVSGTVGPIGFLGLQVSFGLSELFGISDSYSTQLTIILGLILIYTISAVSGVTRGIQILSSFNIGLAILLMTFILLAGPTAFIFDSFIQSVGVLITEFIPMASYRADTGWVNGWTVFFWGWFIGYGPLMAMFIARISRGRTIRQLIVTLSLIAPLVTYFWFTIVGGSGIAAELASPGVISAPYAESGMPAALLAITQQLPWGFLISVLFLVLTTIFVATTGDSMTYTVSMVMTGTDNPPTALRVFWGIMMGVLAAILISIGSGGVSALQSFIVVTAVPVSLILMPSLWNAPKIAKNMAVEQGLK
ncbi:MAG: BCCT family transporter [Porticoccaceae bacterium]|nr:BCCT family transporter [Porticoccaceae bacterium]